METFQTLLFIPLIAALFVRLLARQPQLASAAGTIVVGGLWLWLRGIDANGSVVILWGQPLALTTVTQNLLLLLLAGLTILFALSIIFPSGDWFAPAGLIGFSFLTGSLLIRPFSIAIILVLLATGVLTLTVQTGRAGSVRGSLRYLLASLLAVPLLLIVNGQLEQQSISSLPTGQLTALATLLLLAGFPFHIWLQAVVDETGPLPLTLVIGLAPIVPLALLFQFISAYPNLLDTPFMQLIWLGGGLTLLVAGVLAVTAVHLKRLIGSILLLDMAFTILCLTLPLRVGWETAVSLQIGRFGSLLLLAGGWELLKRRMPNWPLDKLPVGLGRQTPMGLALLGLGLFSLIGLPLTLGFGGHWRLLTAVAELANQGDIPLWLPAITLFSLGLGAIAILRVLVTLLAKQPDDTVAAKRDPIWLQVVVGFVLLAATWLALFPQTVLSRLPLLQLF
jgi:NADH:ubiquinone oxidoreductase subunit 2 (subunit N)